MEYSDFKNLPIASSIEDMVKEYEKERLNTIEKYDLPEFNRFVHFFSPRFNENGCFSLMTNSTREIVGATLILITSGYQGGSVGDRYYSWGPWFKGIAQTVTINDGDNLMWEYIKRYFYPTNAQLDNNILSFCETDASRLTEILKEKCKRHTLKL